MRASLAWRITAAYLALILAILLGLALYVTAFVRAVYLEQLEAQLGAEAAIAAGEVAPLLTAGPASAGAVRELAARVGASGGSRVTIIAPDGVVLGDSAESPDQMENHADRSEVAAALRGEKGISLRRSATVGYDSLYVALPIRADGRPVGVARASLPLGAVDRTADALARTLAVAIGAAGLAAVALAVWIGRTTTEPIKRLTQLAARLAAGGLDARVRVTSLDEVGELGRAFNRMADRLEETFDTISAERNRLAAILETVADGLVILNRNGRVLVLNPAAERLLGIGAEQAAGQPFIAVARDHELVNLVAGPGGGSQLVEIGVPRRYVRAVAAAIPGPEGQRVLLLQDVTELRRLEGVRRDFVANVSHELRTPIAAIKLVVETLEGGALDDPPAAREFLRRLDSEVDRLAQLVRELLELSRIESGQAEVRPRPVPLATLLRGAADRMRPLAERAGLDLRLSLPPDSPEVMADPERVDQVLANLVHNAVKFTPPEGWVELRAGGPGGADGGMAAISVVDSGVGVPPDELDRVFERFFKTDRSRSSGGTGLGLAIAKHLVQAHGGRIWAESDGAHGATFTFTLPLAGPVTHAAEAATVESQTLGATWRRS